MLEKLSHKIGFTNDEIKVVLFLLLVFVTAIGFNYFVGSKSNIAYKTYNYAKEDSLFFAASNRNDTEEDSIAAIRNDVLGLKNDNKQDFKQKKAPPLKGVDLNNASLRKLATLPGIGEKTAQLIIEYREKIGKFSNVNQLDNVKGIGTKKLDKIRPFVIIN